MKQYDGNLQVNLDAEVEESAADEIQEGDDLAD